jgi:hypothetical protein
MLSVLLILAGLGAPAQVAYMPCFGADPAIVGVRRAGRTTMNGVNHYRIAVTVKNVGPRRQAGNTLDSVALYEYAIRHDVKGLQPLGPGETQTVVFDVQRSAEAGAGTTPLRFRIEFTKPVPPGGQDCDPTNDMAALDI